MIDRYREALATDFTTTALKTMIVLWALFIIGLVIFAIDNKWVLAGLLLYEVLP